MKTWIVDVSFKFRIGGPHEVPSKHEIMSVLRNRLSDNRIKTTAFDVTKGRDEDIFFRDLSEG